jgi:hypothetical protein
MPAKRRKKATPKKKVKGFQNVQTSIAKRQGVSRERAGRILGAATRDNPKLRKRAAAGRKRASAKRKRSK